MARQKNDGRGRMGGRAKGTPNRDKPLKQLLRSHSLEYFSPSVEYQGEDGETRMVSQFELDGMGMAPKDRAFLEVQLLAYHTPKMQSSSVDVSLDEARQGIESRLAGLSSDGQTT